MEPGMHVPAARTDGVFITQTQGELLVYDLDRHHIHHLNPLATVVWRLCDGQRTVPDLARLSSGTLGEPVAEAQVLMALALLQDAHLLAHPLADIGRQPRQSRRTWLRRAAVAGAIAVPAVVSLTVSPAAAQTSPPINVCGANCSGLGNAYCVSLAGDLSICRTCTHVSTGLSLCL